MRRDAVASAVRSAWLFICPCASVTTQITLFSLHNLHLPLFIFGRW